MCDLLAVANFVVYIFPDYCAVNVFREEEYIKCVDRNPVMSTRAYAYDVFARMVMYNSSVKYSCSYSPAMLRKRCSYVSPNSSNYYTSTRCIRVGHGLGPSMGWVGLGQSFFNFWWVGMGSVET